MKHDYYLALAATVASASKDRSTKVGAVIVGPGGEVRSTGYNGFPAGIDDQLDYRHERPAKYDWTEHAERNAIYLSSRYGSATDNCSIYVTHHPCSGCARAILQAGICKVFVAPEFSDFKERMAADLAIARQMFYERGIEFKQC